MSHKATNWAISQRGLKPATKLVLWHLCDRHHPDHGCFPAQETLADDCEMSRSNLNTHLAELEARGLIQRIRRSDKANKRQKSTLYLFAFEHRFRDKSDPENEATDPPKPCPESGHGAVSRKQRKPCPENGQSRVQILDTNPVREPVKNPCAARARPFFTGTERFQAGQIADHIGGGGRVTPGAVPDRLRQCLIAEDMISREEAEKHQLLPRED